MLRNSIEPLYFVILAALAVYRVSQLFAYDLGPWHVLEQARLYLGQRAHLHGRHSLWYQLSEWARCPYCSGVWFSLVASMFYAHNVLELGLLALAIAGLQAVLETATQRME